MPQNAIASHPNKIRMLNKKMNHSNTAIMKRNAIIIFSFFLCFIFYSCSKEEIEQEENNAPIISTGKVVTEKTIGMEGGSLKAENFEVTIPVRTFSAPVKVSITKISDNGFGSNALTDAYLINNIPSNATGKLKLSLKIPSTTGNVTLMLISNPFSPSNYGEIISSVPINFEKNGDVAQIEVTLNDLTQSRGFTRSENDESSYFSLGLQAVTGRTSLVTDGEHFKISYPVIMDEEATNLGDYLEEALEKITLSPLNMSTRGRTSWPIDVTIRKLKSNQDGFFEPSILGNNYASLTFNQDKIDDVTQMRATAIHELMHLVQSLYDSRNRYSKAKFESPTLWLDEAVAVWCEGLMMTEASYVPSVRHGHEMAPFEGNFVNRPEDPQNFGYGMSAMIKYITGQYGNACISSIYDKVQNGSKAIDAVKEGLNKLYWEWYGQFIAKYTEGKIYSDMGLQMILGNDPPVVSYDTKSDTLKTVSANYQPLQTRFYKLQINGDNLEDNSKLSIKTKDPNFEYFALYKYKGSEFSLIAQGSTISFEGIKKVLTDGYQCLLTVTNTQYSYSSTAARDIDVQIMLQHQLYKHFWFFVIPYCKVEDSSNSTEVYSVFSWTVANNSELVAKNNVYSSSWTYSEKDNYYDVNISHTGTFSATLNEDKTINFKYDEVIKQIIDENHIATTTVKIEGKNIPLASTTDKDVTWFASPCYGYITNFSYKQEYIQNGKTNIITYTGSYPYSGPENTSVGLVLKRE